MSNQQQGGNQRQRQEIIRLREQTWYPEPERMKLYEELEHLITDPKRHRTRSIAIIAESNGGKTALVKHFLTKHPPCEGKEARVIPVIYVHMTDIPRVEELSVVLLQMLGAPEPEAGNHPKRMKRFLEFAKKVGLKVVILDEFHDCVDTKGRGRPFLRCIKGLMNNGLPVVPVGTEDLAAVLALDPQLASRFNFSRGRLGRLRDVGIVKSFLKQVTELPEREITDAALSYVLSETKGILGHMLDLTEQTMLTFSNLKLESLRDTRSKMDVLDSLT